MTNVNQDSGSTPATKSSGASAGAGLPLRGLAMVLIAVAVLLGLWGVYALTQTGDETTATNAGSTETAEAAQQSPAGDNGAGGGTDGSAAPESEPADAANGASADSQRTTDGREAAEDRASGRDTDRAGEDNRSSTPDSERGAAANTGVASDAAAEEPKINVLNNSLEPGIAEEVFNGLRDQGREMGESGNLPDSDVVVAETTVFFEEGDKAGEEAARELADHINRANGLPAVAKPNDPKMPNEFTGDGQINLVLTGGINV